MFETSKFKFDHVVAIISDSSMLLDQLTNKERMSELSDEETHKVALVLQLLADQLDDILKELRGWKVPKMPREED
jgi:hypothetical protein